jgi:hypothetical protein
LMNPVDRTRPPFELELRVHLSTTNLNERHGICGYYNFICLSSQERTRVTHNISKIEPVSGASVPVCLRLIM